MWDIVLRMMCTLRFPPHATDFSCLKTPQTKLVWFAFHFTVWPKKSHWRTMMSVKKCANTFASRGGEDNKISRLGLDLSGLVESNWTLFSRTQPGIQAAHKTPLHRCLPGSAHIHYFVSPSLSLCLLPPPQLIYLLLSSRHHRVLPPSHASTIVALIKSTQSIFCVLPLSITSRLSFPLRVFYTEKKHKCKWCIINKL